MKNLVKKMTDVNKLLNDKVIEFNSRIKDEPTMSKMIEGKTRTICICVTDGDNYCSKLDDMKLDSFERTEDSGADLAVTASSEILEALINRTLSPVKAYMKGDLKVKASLTDMLLLKKLF